MIKSAILLAEYLDHLKINDSNITLDLQIITKVQKQHLLTFPYQNLEYFKRGDNWIVFDDPKILVKKTISSILGGTCYHLNYSLYWLLGQLGYNCILISASLNRTDFNHMAIVVILDQPYLVDVGFGEFFFRQPIPLSGEARNDISGSYQITKDRQSGKNFLWQLKKNRWRIRYSFDLDPKKLTNFEIDYHWLSDNPNAYKTNMMYRKHLENGYFSYYRDQLTVVKDGITKKFQLPIGKNLFVLEERYNDCSSPTYTQRI